MNRIIGILIALLAMAGVVLAALLISAYVPFGSVIILVLFGLYLLRGLIGFLKEDRKETKAEGSAAPEGPAASEWPAERKAAPGPAEKEPVIATVTGDPVPKKDVREVPVPELSEQKRRADELVSACYDEKTGIFDREAYERQSENVLKEMDSRGREYLEEKLREAGADQVRRLNNALLKPAMQTSAILQLPGALGMASYRSMLDQIPYLFSGGNAGTGKGCPDTIAAYADLLRSIAGGETECTREMLEKALELTADMR